ncbi:flagellar hook-length control protein FliK [Methylobacterium sp. 1030]|uniref:flagellar hook-length control protein FliK n=1 Tax=Methylobacterium sp. 1030 TaxID=3156404 RepID=UPI003397FED2
MNAIQASAQMPVPKTDRASVQPAGDRARDAGDGRPERDAFAALLRVISGEAASTGSEVAEPEQAATSDLVASDLPSVPDAGAGLAALLAAVANLPAGAALPVPGSATTTVAAQGEAAPLSVAEPARSGPDLALAAAISTGDEAAAVPAGAIRVITRETHFELVGSTTPAPGAPTLAAPPPKPPIPAPPAPVEGAQARAAPAAASVGIPEARPTPRGQTAVTADASDAGSAPVETDAGPPSVAPEGHEAVTPAAKATPAGAFRSREAELATVAPMGSAADDRAAALPQVAAAIQEEVERIAEIAPHAHVDTAARTPADGTLRVLKIQLRPADLGLVTVEMRLKDGRLEAYLHASQPETADLLRRSSGALGDLLSRSGCQADLVVLDRPRAPEGPPPAAMPDPGQTFEAGGQGANGGARQHRFAGDDTKAVIPGESRTDETSSYDDDRSHHLYL